MLIRKSSYLPVAWTHRGVSKGALGQPAVPVADYNDANRLNPNYVDTYINRGSAKRAFGNHDGGKNDMDKVMDLAQEQE